MQQNAIMDGYKKLHLDHSCRYLSTSYLVLLSLSLKDHPIQIYYNLGCVNPSFRQTYLKLCSSLVCTVKLINCSLLVQETYDNTIL